MDWTDYIAIYIVFCIKAMPIILPIALILWYIARSKQIDVSNASQFAKFDEDIHRDFLDNPVLAANKYKGRKVKITGSINKIIKQFDGGYNITLWRPTQTQAQSTPPSSLFSINNILGTESGDISCFFVKDNSFFSSFENRVVRNLHHGQIVTIVGSLVAGGGQQVNYHLVNCSMLEPIKWTKGEQWV